MNKQMPGKIKHHRDQQTNDIFAVNARLAPRIHSKYVVGLLVAVMLYLSGHLFVHLYHGWRP